MFRSSFIRLLAFLHRLPFRHFMHFFYWGHYHLTCIRFKNSFPFARQCFFLWKGRFSRDNLTHDKRLLGQPYLPNFSGSQF